jgi:streptogramin lyase
MSRGSRTLRAGSLAAIAALLGACGVLTPPASAPSSSSATSSASSASSTAPSSTTTPTRPTAWAAPEVLVAPSSFAGVHGLAIDAKGRLLAGSVLGNTLWEVDRATGAAKVLVDAPEGQADDIAVGPNGELAWTNYLMGKLRYRENDTAPMRVLAKDLPGLNSLDFDRRNGKLYASQVFLGDALWEIDREGKKPPRLIKKDMGGFNGFEVGPDGLLYGPLWFKGQVVKIDPAHGNMTVIADGFKIPAAANLDGKGNLWVVDARSGELVRVDLASGKKTVARQLRPALDNLAIAPDGTIYVSNMASNEVQAFNPATGELRTLTSGKVAVPAGMKIDGHNLWVADVFGFRQVDVRTGDVRDVFLMQRDPELDYPFAVGLSAKLFALTSWFTGSVQLVDRQTLKTVETIHGLKAPFDAIPMADGSVVYAELATGSITRASGPKFAEKLVLASGLNGPVQMIVGQDGALYVTEAAGKLLRIPLDASAPLRTVADGLALPEGVAQTPWGSFIVAESAARRLVEIDPGNGSRRTVAENLPIGLAPGPGLPPPYVVTGVAVGSDGTVYMSANRNNAIYRIRSVR